MTNDQRIAQLAQDIQVARYSRLSDATGSALDDLLNQTIIWVNQLIPEIEKKAYWNFVRTNDDSIGTITTGSVISYALPSTINRVVIDPKRDVTIRFGSTIISSFKLVNPNQSYDPSDPSNVKPRATVLKRQLIFSRPLNSSEVGGTITADTVAKIPRLSHTDVSLLDILDDANYDDIRQLFILGVIKNQVLPDIIQGGLTPSFSQKFDRHLAECIANNNASADADDQDREDFAWIAGVGF